MADAKRVDSGAGLAGIAEMLKLFGGQNTTTQNVANTQQLQQILAQLQGQDPQAMLQSIFAQAAGQMPGLQARYTNAIGGRTANNGALQASLEKLLADTTMQAQQRLADQQLKNTQVQGDLASTIAKLNSRQVQTQGTDMGQAAKVIGGLQMLGKLMDSSVGKKGMEFMDGLFSSGGDESLTSAADAGMNFDFSGMLDSAGGSNAFLDQVGLDFSGDMFSGIGDLFSSSSDDLVGDVADSGGDFFDFDWGFKNGGLVGRDNVQHFAEGGVVRSGGGRRSSAPTYTPDEIVRARVAGQHTSSSGPTQGASGERSPASSNAATPAPSIPLNFGGGNNFSFGVGNLTDRSDSKDLADAATTGGKFGLGVVTGASIPGVTLGPLGVLIKMIQMGMRQQATMNDLNAAADPIAALAAAQGWIPGTAISTADAVAAANALSRVGGTDSMDELMDLTDAFGTKRDNDRDFDDGGDSGSSFDGGNFGGSDGGSGDSGSGSVSGMDEAVEPLPETTDYKRGGRVVGPGTGTSDSVPARLSNGEYVIPAAVVENLGVEFFDTLRAQFGK